MYICMCMCMYMCMYMCIIIDIGYRHLEVGIHAIQDSGVEDGVDTSSESFDKIIIRKDVWGMMTYDE